MKRKSRVCVGLSGGVDSSVAALRLLEQGYEVVGVFIKVWHPDWMVCKWEDERRDAMRVAAKLKIPFLTCDAVTAYKQGVADYFIAEYTAGRTPNPDVMCNKMVKFGAFLTFAEEHGADYIATGHYAQSSSPDLELYRGIDQNKDQTYFLWTLTQRQLAKTLFPVGTSPKADIRAEAKQAGLLTAEKKDSQGICFLGHINIAEFLSHYTNLTPGAVLDEKGTAIGTHQGALIYTTGQRHGFTVHTAVTTTTAHYVLSRNIEENTITVGSTKPTQPEGSFLHLTEVNLLVASLHDMSDLTVQTRYRQAPQSVRCVESTEDKLVLELTVTTDAVSVGQSCVLYRGNQCLGGGIIENCTYETSYCN